jgi:hypothetical protein
MPKTVGIEVVNIPAPGRGRGIGRNFRDYREFRLEGPHALQRLVKQPEEMPKCECRMQKRDAQ